MDRADYFNVLFFVTNLFLLTQFVARTNTDLIQAFMSLQSLISIPAMLFLVTGMTFVLANCSTSVSLVLASDTATESVERLGRSTVIAIGCYLCFVLANLAFYIMVYGT